jgi:hypothetical protein
MAQAISGETPITIDGVKYKVRTTIVYQDGLGTQGTLSTSAPLRYTIQYKPLSPIPLVGDPLQQWITLGERDVANQNGWIFTPAAGAGFQKALIAKGSNSLTVSLDRSTANALSKSSGVTTQQALQILQTAPNVAPTAVDPDQPVNGVPTPELESLEIPEIKAKFDQKNHGNLVYPTNLRNNKQDYIKFTSYTYVGRKISPSLTSSGYTPGISERDIKDTKGSAILPIQPSITDMNTVRWGGEEMNPVGLFAASASYKMRGSNPGQGFGEAIDHLVKIGGDPNIVNAFKLYAAGNAASVGGLLSRVSGSVLNPNLELLFQGPELRPFDFVFLLSPRNSGEATEVKKIIRFFKESMVVRTTENNLFLKAPNVFDIKYYNGDNTEHTSLNKIKKCALTACSINYTPSNQYMTFENPSSGYPMTSYNMTLRFQELEPVIDKDYVELEDLSETNRHIGY